MALRILASVGLLFSVLFLPFWVSAILCIALMVYFNLFWEGVLLFLLSDLLFGVKEERYFNMVFVSAIMALFALIAIEALKKKMFYHR